MGEQADEDHAPARQAGTERWLIEAKNHPALRIALREGVKQLDDSSA